MDARLRSERKTAPPRRIAFLIHDNCEVLDLCGPLDAFYYADLRLFNLGRTEQRGYECLILAATPNPVRTRCGITIVPTQSYRDGIINLDTIIVVGGEDCENLCKDESMVGWVRSAAPRARRIASVCTGSFVLAAAGLLDGKRVTTHWMFAELLAETFPSLQVDARLIYARDGNVYTSGGVTAGIDLAFALIEEDLGPEIALATSRLMVAFPHRPQGQSQFSGYFTLENSVRKEIGELQDWINAHPDEDLSIPALAKRIDMSPRNLARLFRSETGVTPGQFVERARADAARYQLELTGKSLQDIASTCGFEDVERMRRTFRKFFDTSPADYRARFRSASPAVCRD